MYFQQPLRAQLDKMKCFIEFLILSCLVTALAHTLGKPAKSNDGLKKKRSDMNNYYYAGGQNCNKTEQQLAKIIEMLEEIRSSPPQNKNETGVTGPPKADSGDNTGKAQSDMINNYYSQGHCKKIEQHLLEIKQEIRSMKEKPWSFRGKVSKNCAEVFKSGSKISGLYKINPDGLGEFEVFCDQKTAGGGWTVFQRRQDGSVDFFRGWNDYKLGFGNLNGEFWLGLDKIHRLTSSTNKKLRVDLEATAGTILLAEYSSFVVANEKAKYQLTVGGYSGNAGDSLAYHNGMFFTTKDSDNDKWSKNCVSSWKGAWWYKSCYNSNLNALYLYSKSSQQGMAWMKWKDNYLSFKRSEMKIRPKNF